MKEWKTGTTGGTIGVLAALRLALTSAVAVRRVSIAVAVAIRLAERIPVPLYDEEERVLATVTCMVKAPHKQRRRSCLRRRRRRRRRRSGSGTHPRKGIRTAMRQTGPPGNEHRVVITRRRNHEHLHCNNTDSAVGVVVPPRFALGLCWSGCTCPRHPWPRLTRRRHLVSANHTSYSCAISRGYVRLGRANACTHARWTLATSRRSSTCRRLPRYRSGCLPPFRFGLPCGGGEHRSPALPLCRPSFASH